jgi:hypothetical protein
MNEERKLLQLHEIQVGTVVARYASGSVQREFSLQPVRIRPSYQKTKGIAGSVEADWISIGYELCSREEGSERWTPEGGVRYQSILEAVEALGRHPRIPDEALLPERAVEVRAEIRQEHRRSRNAQTSASEESTEESTEEPVQEPEEPADAGSDS